MLRGRAARGPRLGIRRPAPRLDEAQERSEALMAGVGTFGILEFHSGIVISDAGAYNTFNTLLPNGCAATQTYDGDARTLPLRWNAMPPSTGESTNRR